MPAVQKSRVCRAWTFSACGPSLCPPDPAVSPWVGGWGMSGGGGAEPGRSGGARAEPLVGGTCKCNALCVLLKLGHNRSCSGDKPPCWGRAGGPSGLPRLLASSRAEH